MCLGISRIQSYDELRVAVKEWCRDENVAMQKYGNIKFWDISLITNMKNMFRDLERLVFNADISGWNVSAVTSMYGMFYKATSFNGDLSGWDVSSVEDMGSMFHEATFFNKKNSPKKKFSLFKW